MLFGTDELKDSQIGGQRGEGDLHVEGIAARASKLACSAGVTRRISMIPDPRSDISSHWFE